MQFPIQVQTSRIMGGRGLAVVVYRRAHSLYRSSRRNNASESTTIRSLFNYNCVYIYIIYKAFRTNVNQVSACIPDYFERIL